MALRKRKFANAEKQYLFLCPGKYIAALIENFVGISLD